MKILKEEIQRMFNNNEEREELVVKVNNCEEKDLKNLGNRYFNKKNLTFILTPIAKTIIEGKENITYVKINKLYIGELTNLFFKNLKEFIVSENQQSFIIKDELEKIINKNFYLEKFKEKLYTLFIENFSFDILYKGYKTFYKEGIVTKKFIAEYLVLLYKKNNLPYVKFCCINKNPKTLYLPNCRDYKKENNSICMKYEKLNYFLDYNNIDDEKILIDPNSIDCFYCFKSNYFVNPTTKWVEEWWNYDCPVLYKYQTNKDRNKNLFNINPICWDSILVEAGLTSNYIDEDITEKEIEKFAGKYKHTTIYKSMINVLETKNLTENQKKDMLLKAKNYIKKIQKLIDDNKLEILRDTVIDCSTNSMEDINVYNEEHLKSRLTNLDRKMGLDCGFLYIKSENEEIHDLILKLAEFNSEFYKNGSLKLEYPWIGQSTTIQRSMAKSIEKILTKHNINISYWTELD